MGKGPGTTLLLLASLTAPARAQQIEAYDGSDAVEALMLDASELWREGDRRGSLQLLREASELAPRDGRTAAALLIARCGAEPIAMAARLPRMDADAWLRMADAGDTERAAAHAVGVISLFFGLGAIASTIGTVAGAGVFGGVSVEAIIGTAILGGVALLGVAIGAALHIDHRSRVRGTLRRLLEGDPTLRLR